MPEVKAEDTITAQSMTFCILEDMTKERKSGVSFVLKLPGGGYAVFNTTENIMNGMIASFQGALKRFESERSKRKLMEDKLFIAQVVWQFESGKKTEYYPVKAIDKEDAELKVREWTNAKGYLPPLYLSITETIE